MYSREDELKSIFTRIAVVLLLLILFFNIYSLAYVGRDFLLALFPKVIWLDCVTDILCAFLYFLSFFLPALIFYGLSSGRSARPIDFSMTLPTPHTLFKTTTILLLSVGTIVAMAYFNAWLLPTFASSGGVDPAMEPYQLVLAVFSSAVIPAFAEELLFRGVILSNLKPYGKGMAVVLSALLFGLMHMNASQLLYATAAGLVLGAVYVATDSLWLCILIHFSNNLFSLLENYMFGIFKPETAGLICMLAEAVILALGILFALICTGMKKNEPWEERRIGVFGVTQEVDSCTAVEGGQMLKQFFCPAMIIYIVAVVVNMVYVLISQYLMTL
ncbi:MAG: CPBP family intramembrane metalloprotease [Clostridia bacterium]|nr:CPBP family intramembrane metalloprotease [Clostridia bacterium]